MHLKSIRWFLIELLIVSGAASAAAAAPQAQPPLLPHFFGDGVTLNTAALNAAIEALSQAGGGTLSLPPGRYLTGAIYLKSGVTLHLQNGAVIVGSTNLADYPRNPPPFPSQVLLYGRYSLICAIGQHDVAITGEGQIYGQGDHPNFNKKVLQDRGWAQQDAYLNRPYGLYFKGCHRVQVRNVKLQNLGYRTQLYLDCDDVLVDGVTVDNAKDDHNNDGLDVDGSRNVRISNCYVVAGDDGINLKSSYAACENVTISNCVVHSLCNGFKFGAASRGGFKNVSIANCAIYETGAAGIALEIVDGGVLDGVTITNLSMTDVGAPLCIRLGNRGQEWIDGQGPATPGTLRNVIVRGITASVTARDGTMASSITGLPGHPVENVEISDVRVTLKPGHGKVQLDAFQLKRLNDARNRVERDFGNEVKRVTLPDVPEVPSDYPEYSMFGPLPAYGFFCRHVKNLTFDHVDLAFETPEHRSALAIQDVRGLSVDCLRASSSQESNPVLLLRDVTDALLSDCAAQEGTPVFLRVEGDSDHVSLLASDLSRAVAPVSLGPGLDNRNIRVGPEIEVRPVPSR